ncbi:MAG: hypothetical protein DDT21_02648 [Syntrophomonadaceae bacterium]|nr:hypothetical protein [Bacillota bacterium]
MQRFPLAQRGASAPSLAEVQRFSVNRAGEFEAVRQSLYDFQTYPAAGITQMMFFQVPAGQGTKTLADTNMEIAGSLPNPKMQLVQSIEILLFPDSSPSSTAAVTNPSAFVNDTYLLSRSGWVEFFIGSKAYLLEAPIGRFPPKTRLDGFGAVNHTLAVAGTTTVRDSYAVLAGRPYIVDPWILLKPTQNFRVSLNWPVAIPISAPARIGLVLDGILYRNSQ